MPTIRELAREMRSALGVPSEAMPDWVESVRRQAGNGMEPDEWRANAIEECIASIANHTSIDYARAVLPLEENLESLASWLGSIPGRSEYVNAILEEYRDDPPRTIVELLQAGQLREKQEAFELVLESLRDLADAMNSEEAEVD